MNSWWIKSEIFAIVRHSESPKMELSIFWICPFQATYRFQLSLISTSSLLRLQKYITIINKHLPTESLVNNVCDSWDDDRQLRQGVGVVVLVGLCSSRRRCYPPSQSPNLDRPDWDRRHPRAVCPAEEGSHLADVRWGCHEEYSSIRQDYRLRP